MSILSCILLASCKGGGETPPDMSKLLGPYTATGTVSATGASLYRRGTHLLLMSGRPRFYLESKTLNLNEYQDDLVVVQGELTVNTYAKFLPVLQVASIRKIDAPKEEETQEYTVAALSLSLKAPSMWKSILAGGKLSFAHPKEEKPFVTIEKSTVTDLPEGVPLRIDGRNGIRVVEEGTGAHRVFVQLSNEETILFTFAPQGQESMQLRDVFYTMLQSVRFTMANSSSSAGSTEVIQGSRQPCGGSAGVLCPSGEYCDVREIDTGIGICRSL